MTKSLGNGGDWGLSGKGITVLGTRNSESIVSNVLKTHERGEFSFNAKYISHE